MTDGRYDTRKRGGKFIPALCNLLGTLILLGVVALLLPLTAPRLMGYEVYNVVSESMTPAIPMGSIVYVRPVEAGTVRNGDVIAFRSGGSVITHRVVNNRVVEGEFVTKGDANAEEDFNPVPYMNLIGLVDRHIPLMGDLMAHLTTSLGKAYLLCLIACGVMFNILAGRLRALHG